MSGRAKFCSRDCNHLWQNAQRSAARFAAKATADRFCKGCGHLIAPERMAHAIYCSKACKIRSQRHETYGLTRRELEVLLAQHEMCVICRTQEWGPKGPQVDHCHETGRVRGVLCVNCNNGLGRFKDSPDLLRAAIRYLEGASVSF